MINVIRQRFREGLTVCVSVLLLSISFYSSESAAQLCCGEVFAVNYSTSSDRSLGLGLEGASVTGNIHVFVNPISPSSNFRKVKWYMDSPIKQANVLNTDSAAPYDFIGGNSLAIPLDTTALADGPHTITAKIIFGGSPRVRQDVTVTFTVANNVVPPPATGSWEFGIGEGPERLFAAAEMFPDPTGVLELFFGEIFVFIGESNTCNLVSCIPVVDPQNTPPPVITGVTYTFDIGTLAEWVVNTDTLAPYDLGAVGATLDNPGFNLDTLPIGIHTLTATIAIVDGDPVTLTRSFISQPLIAVLPPTSKGEIPLEDDQLIEGNGIIASNDATIALGRAFYWDLQTGSDGKQSCASCHYHAGVDNRVLNTVNPKSGGFEVSSGGPGGTLDLADFNFHQFADPLNRNSAVTRSINDAVGSQGLPQRDFAGVNIGSDAESFTAPAMLDPDFVDINGTQHRRVTGRNTPTNINAAFNVRNFWDGRANFVFNGRNPFGARDNSAVVFVDNDGPGGAAPVGVQLRVRFSSLASQAVGPPTSDVEMTYSNRTFPDLGQKLLNLTPLAKQTIASDDSVFGAASAMTCIIAGGCAGPGGMGLSMSYPALIMMAFDPKYWNGDGVMIDGVLYSLMEANFSMFWGLAIQKWEFTLISDDSKWDRFRAGTPGMGGTQQQKLDLAIALMGDATEPNVANSAPFDPADILTNAETAGMMSFLGGECAACHGGSVLSAATTPFMTGAVPAAEPVEQIVERMLMEQGIAALELGLPAPSAIYDIGFYNIAIRPTGEDLGVGGQDDFGNPLSFSSQLQSGIHVDDGLDAPIPGALPRPDFLVVDPNMFVRSPGASTIGEPIAVNGAFKVPSLRNVELTAPYMHNGGHVSLEDVIAFYARGADFIGDNIADVDPEVGGIGNLRGNPDGVADLKTFLMTFTDHRVKEEAAPFDHPSLLIENGVVVKAVGSGGMGTGIALPTFVDRLNGPTARADDYVINVDQVLDDNLLDNDSDGDSSGIVQNPVMIAMEGPASGIVDPLDNDGSFTYTPDVGFRGVDSFAYDVDTTDGADPRSNVARVTIQVGSAEPVANPDMYDTGFNTPLVVAAPGVLGNDSDPDDSAITAALVGPAPANAVPTTGFTFNSDGSFSYTPNPGFSGPDTFMYTANDTDGPSAPAMVTIEVAPDATPCPV
ncbi:MAG: cadherin-like domain-containing protein, partial [Planctomycetaceae bacterium]|nr:cadherin-like domain-containing protein [Planctomycetaceae bacterium]